MRYLITGGCGFLGSNLAYHAIQKGEEVIVFDNLERFGASENLKWLKSLKVNVLSHGDIRDSGAVSEIVKSYKPEVVFHLAGQVAMTKSIANPRLDFEVNALGTLNVLEAVRMYSPQAVVIYSSTNKVYGGLNQYSYRELETRYVCVEKPLGFDETTPIEFSSPYGCSKGAADQYMQDYARVYGLKTTVFRHSSMYGGRQFPTYDQGWVAWFCLKGVELIKDRLSSPFTVSGSGKQVRDILHVDDMVKLYFAVVSTAGVPSGSVFNIGGGYPSSVSILELLEIIGEKLEIPMKFERISERQSDQKVFISDIHKIKKIVGWEPKISARHGVSDMVDWIYQNAS